MFRTSLIIAAVASTILALPQAATSVTAENPATTITPSSLEFTYYFANAACSGPNITQTLTPNKCTFIEFDDGQGALNYGSLVRGNDFSCTSTCYLETWNAETCAGSPHNIIRADDAGGCTPTLGGLSAKLVC